DLAAGGADAATIAATLADRADDLRMVVSLETLEYLKKGGRISGAQAAIGTLLSVKPIIAVEHGVVETADKPRTRSKSRERCIELIVERPIERISILHTLAPDVEAFTDEVVRRANLSRSEVMVSVVGPSVGPHLGPGGVGAAVLYRR
ncbi:MAG TPA: DegV family protein, partial [Candidatus Limnocylindrales bacterium]|nr:DegV family protein [Candidatus Limnocylindrales bacterium]